MQKLKGHYRKFRFPSIRAEVAKANGSEFEGGYEEGLEQGRQKGFDEGIQEGLLQGREQGQKEGFDHGYQEGLSNGKASFDEAIESLAGVADAFESARSESAQNHMELICTLVEQVSKKVIHTELMLNPDQIMRLITEALEQLDTSNNEPVTIHLSSEDANRLKKKGVSDIQGYNFTADKSLSSGACRIASKSQEINVDVDQRIDQCMDSVKEHLSDTDE